MRLRGWRDVGRVQRCVTLGIALVGSAGLLGACSSGTYVPCDTCEDAGGGGTEPSDAGGAPPSPSGCDPSKPPEESVECLNDADAVFVSSAGNKQDRGDRARPVRTIAAAMTKLEGKKRIYVCEGEYPENVKVTRPISIVGGYDCTWRFTGVKPKIMPPSGVALEVRDARGVTVDDLELLASSDESVPGDSAIAAFASNSEARFRTLAITAGDGQVAASGAVTAGTTSNWSGAPAPGMESVSGTGAPAAECRACSDGTRSTSGRGADLGGVAASGAASPPTGASNAGTSGADSCTAGGRGADGAPALAGRSQRVPLPHLAASGWVTSVPATGYFGKPGQGGGGGGAHGTALRGGSAGGCGGCGGGWGHPGRNGGSSFAVLSFRSELSLDSCTRRASAGGNGANGGYGESGQPGGTSRSNAPACAGGEGGGGGGGPGGGGGHGGHSAAIGYVGAEPKTRNCSLTISATLGRGGLGALGGDGASGRGPEGVPGTDGKGIHRFALGGEP